MLLYKDALVPIASVMFSKERACHNKWHLFNAGALIDNVITIYSIVC